MPMNSLIFPNSTGRVYVPSSWVWADLTEWWTSKYVPWRGHKRKVQLLSCSLGTLIFGVVSGWERSGRMRRCKEARTTWDDQASSQRPQPRWHQAPHMSAGRPAGHSSFTSHQNSKRCLTTTQLSPVDTQNHLQIIMPRSLWFWARTFKGDLPLQKTGNWNRHSSQQTY